MSKHTDRYQLKQWYPSLPVAWKYFKEEVVVAKRGSHYIGDTTKLSSAEVENNPEYWVKIEELCVPKGTKFMHKQFDRVYTVSEIHADHIVITWDRSKSTEWNIVDVNKLFDDGVWIVVDDNQKNYEIHQIKAPCSAIITYENGNPIHRTDDVPVGATADLSTALQSGVISITSVKRLADNQVFTVKDKVTSVHTQNRVHTIKSFEVKDDDRIVVHTSWNKENLNGQMIEDIHIVEPIFTTEDGVDIFKGDYVWVPQKSPIDNKYILNGYVTRFKMTKERYEKSIIYFSSKEKAEEWIKLNKLQYSQNDILKAITKLYNNGYLTLRGVVEFKEELNINPK